MSQKIPIVRAATLEDADAIATIYNWYINHTVITFEEQEIDAAAMRARMSVGDETCPWLVLEFDSAVIGYACAAIWKSRSAYKLSREVSIYLSQSMKGHGYGKLLYGKLLDVLRDSPIHTLVAGIALPNPGSVKLHESFGFEAVGQFTEIGRKFDKFVDVGYWQLRL